MDPWSVSSPPAPATGSSEATLTSMRPAPPGYSSRARPTRTGPRRSMPSQTKPGGSTQPRTSTCPGPTRTPWPRRATAGPRPRPQAGYFKEQILPVEIPGKRGAVTVVDKDEHVRPDVSLEDMAKLKPAFAKDGTVTAGNASGINDAAAAVVLASGSFVNRSGLVPMARLVGYAHAGVQPRIMGMGPVPATQKVLDRTGVKLDEIDLYEVNEAFAAQALACARELDLPPERTNPNGSGISLGHPVAATGAILTVKSVYELKRTGGRYALVTMCIGGGQGIAAIFERA